MIITITPNTALGRTAFVPTLQVNRRNAVTRGLLAPSGKGVNAAGVAHSLGAPTLALGFTAGDLGRLFDTLLRNRGVPADWVWTDGETRMNVILIGEQDGTYTTISDESLLVTAAHEAALLAKLEHYLPQATCVTLGGPLPKSAAPDLYARLIALAHTHQVPLVMDAIGPAMREWLRAKPAWFKPNRDELAFLLERKIESVADVLAGAVAVQRDYGVNVLASCDAEGAIAVTGEGAWRLYPLPIPVVSPEGAGDAMVAGLAMALAQKLPLVDCLRFCSAVAAGAVMQAGVGVCDPADVERWLSHVQIEAVGQWDSESVGQFCTDVLS